MITKELLEHLSYSKCDCPIDYREELGVFNGVCPKHSGSMLMVDGKPISIFLNEIKAKANKLAHRSKGIV